MKTRCYEITPGALLIALNGELRTQFLRGLSLWQRVKLFFGMRAK